MADLLSSGSYGSVRAAIDITLSSTLLPDATIALDVFAGAAVADVLALDPSAESRSGDELAAAQRAAIYFCAARLLPALPQITREEREEHSYQRQSVDVAARVAELRGLASAAIDGYLATDAPTDDMPTMFGTAAGERGRW